MTSAEFINELKECLSGEVSPQILQENVNYYSQYIISEINAGKSEEQVIQELGPARLIAKTIIDAEKGASEKEEQRQEEQRKQDYRQRERDKRHLHTGVNDKGEFDVKYGNFSFNSWYGKLLLILLAIVVLVILVAAVIGIIYLSWYLIPIVLVIGFVIGLIVLFIRLGSRK